MQKLSKDKKIEETAREELKSSMSRALEDLKLSDREGKAAVKLTAESISPRVKQISRAEVFKEENPEFIGRKGTAREKEVNARVFESMREAAREFGKKLGGNFIDVSIVGSRALGHAAATSDIDVVILLKRSSHADLDKAEDAIKEFAQAIKAKTSLEVNCNTGHLDFIKEHVADRNRDFAIDYIVADQICNFFLGIPFGDGQKLQEARKEIIRALAGRPDGEALWEDTRHVYFKATAGLVGRKNFRRAESKLGVSGEDFEEIVKAREKFALPTFDEIKKHYGVA